MHTHTFHLAALTLAVALIAPFASDFVNSMILDLANATAAHMTGQNVGN